MHEKHPISVTIPAKAQAKVISCEPVRGNSGDSSSFKNAILDNGMTLSVPDFIKEGDIVVIDLNLLVYKERIK
jgi:elongation factor P